MEWERDERLVLERNPDYWQGPADASRVTFRFIPEFSARMAALLAGEIDIMKDVPPHAVEVLEQERHGPRCAATVSSRINYLALVNLKPGPMQDLRVRQAMNHAVNVDELIKQVLKGRATRMCGPLAPANVDYSPVECYKYDPARAQALFKEAGRRSHQAPLTLDTPSGPLPARQGRLARHRRPAPAPRASRPTWWSTSGARTWTRSRTATPATCSSSAGARRSTARARCSRCSSPTRPTRPTATTRRSTTRSPGPQTLLDPKARAEAYAELQKIVHDEAPWVFLWQQHDLYGVTQTIEWTPRADEKVWMYDAKIVAK